MPRGDFSFKVFKVASACSEPSRCNAAMMFSMWSWANQRSTVDCIAATGPAVSPVAKLSIKRLISPDCVPGRTFVSASRNSASRADGNRWLHHGAEGRRSGQSR